MAIILQNVVVQDVIFHFVPAVPEKKLAEKLVMTVHGTATYKNGNVLDSRPFTIINEPTDYSEIQNAIDIGRQYINNLVVQQIGTPTNVV